MMNTNPNLAFINCNVIDGNMDSKIITEKTKTTDSVFGNRNR